MSTANRVRGSRGTIDVSGRSGENIATHFEPSASAAPTRLSTALSSDNPHALWRTFALGEPRGLVNCHIVRTALSAHCSCTRFALSGRRSFETTGAQTRVRQRGCRTPRVGCAGSDRLAPFCGGTSRVCSSCLALCHGSAIVPRSLLHDSDLNTARGEGACYRSAAQPNRPVDPWQKAGFNALGGGHSSGKLNEEIAGFVAFLHCLCPVVGKNVADTPAEQSFVARTDFGDVRVQDLG